MKMQGPIAFRCDASERMGSGHVMRCLTLADELKRHSLDCVFVCRERAGDMTAQIQKRGYRAIALPLADNGEDADWLGVPLTTEIEQARTVFDTLTPSRIIVDHYGLDAKWEERAAPDGCPVMAIDDMADRPHNCDVLLDQNLGRRAEDYDGLVSDKCARLIGPRYALLRPKFGAARAQSLARRQGNTLQHILISMGGMDADNATGSVLETLSGLPKTKKLTVILGPNAPHINDVKQRAKAMSCRAELLINVTEMAELMSQADLAIGAVGGTAWERCCLGLPTLTLVLADNQLPAAEALSKEGASLMLGQMGDGGWQKKLNEYVDFLTDPIPLFDMSHKAANVTDGLGRQRIVDTLLTRDSS